MPAASLQLAGIDFTSSPSRRKPIVVAIGRVESVRAGIEVGVERLELHSTFASFEAWLNTPRDWFGAFDFPFGLPRAFVDANALGSSCDEVIRTIKERCPMRMAWRAFVDAWGNTQPAGRRLLHRRTDVAWPEFSSTSPLQTRYVPVGFMYYEGFARLVEANVTVPGMRDGEPKRTAVEGYPGLLAHQLIGRRSYKNDESSERREARGELLRLLEDGVPRLRVRLRLDGETRDEALDDAGGDRLDALLCLAQAAWAQGQVHAGVPEGIDPIEGWIVGMPFSSV